jgi:hypothetical protein
MLSRRCFIAGVLSLVCHDQVTAGSDALHVNLEAGRKV